MFDPVTAGDTVAGIYSLELVLLSFVIAVFASFTALDLGARIGESRGIARKKWIAGCAFTMGGGIWSMHFTGMLAFKLPLAVTYDIRVTSLSFIIAVIASGFAFFLANARPIKTPKIVLGGLIMGIGVGSMHYAGMAAMEFAGSMYYKLGLFVLSVLIAVLAATAALWLIIKSGNEKKTIPPALKITSSFIMGLAVVGMHYTGMAATVYVVPQNASLLGVQSTQDIGLLVSGISGISFLILGITIFISLSQKKLIILAKSQTELENRIVSLSKFPDENPNPCLRVNEDAILIYANQPALNLLEKDNCKQFDLIPDPFHSVVKKVLSSHINSSVEIKFEDQVFIFDAVFVPEMKYVNVYGREMTALNKARDAIFAERQNLYNMLDNLPMAFHLQAPDYSVPYANKMFRERFGSPEKKPCYELMYRGSTPCEKCTPFTIFESGKTEASIWTDWRNISYLTIMTPFKDLDGSPLVMEMALDITEQEATRKQLIDAKEEAQEANKAKSEFLSRMSHELRTPMNAILGFAQLLSMAGNENLTEIQQKNLDTILTSGNHLLELIDEVLDISRIDQGEQKISIEDVRLNSLVQELISMVRSIAEKRSIKVLNCLSDDDLVVRADHTQLRQVLINLISNAIKYNKDNGLVILEGKTTNEGKVQFSVSDQGHGIPKEELEKVFEPFYRLELDVSKEVEGTGLGLTITKKLVENMHGAITVNSTPGEGSCFTLEFPATNKAESKDDRRQDTTSDWDKKNQKPDTESPYYEQPSS